MNTPAHLLIGWAAFARNKPNTIVAAALVGGLLPDLSLYVMASTSLFILDIPPSVVFGQLYFSDLWQTIFSVDNSFFVWGALLALAIWKKKEWGIALCGAALLHLLGDLPLHHDDGRAHFWPLTNWIFESPLSYWDTRHHAGIIGPLEFLLCLGCAIAILWQRLVQRKAVLVVVLLIMEGVAILPGFFGMFA
ncbi:hypothetical protein [Cognatishimia activa]|uniref:Cobalamin biosynthesis protein CobQ n=1 Tax=Cognatishimia activa TaxID=1715691 RepID=A0A0N7MB29_9RHOB|nr:hypothetical protein [Cognatishimia activa]CUI27874.1 hypothetical protein TA5113_00063 [Cognatishimia activa]CUK24256.1 hypothetical protein TA5114_00032 [Cognatishimia activa]